MRLRKMFFMMMDAAEKAASETITPTHAYPFVLLFFIL